MSDVKPVAWKYREPVTRIATFRTKRSGTLLSLEYIEEPIYSQKTITALQAEIEAMRKDVERLEYLANDMQDMTFNGVEVLDFIEEDCDWPKAWRKAIDAAIAKEKQP